MKGRARAPLPLATLALTAAILAVFVVELAGGQALCSAYGLIPANPSLLAAMMSLFLHDPENLAHVAGNLAVLLFVGSRVEHVIGSTRFALIYFAGGLAGSALHIAVDPTSTIALVGASGSLFALLAIAATLLGPGMLAFAAVLVAANIAYAFDAPGAEGVSFAGHLGGFAAGAAAVVLARVRGIDGRRAVTA